MCSHVLSIPLQSNQNRDVLTWKENNSQTFSIKSAYQVAIMLKEQTRIEHSPASKDRTHCKKIWKLNVPPKVRNFNCELASIFCLPGKVYTGEG